MNLFEGIKMAYKSVVANKLRAFLTMLGIIIGISSVITIISLGLGGQEAITAEFMKIGAASLRVGVAGSKAQSTDYITLEDVKYIKEQVEMVKYASPSIQTVGYLINDQEEDRAYISAGSPDLAYINNTEILYGRYFTEGEYEVGAGVAVVDLHTAESLFGYGDVVGEELTLRLGGVSKKIKIIGVEKGIDLSFPGSGHMDRPAMAALPLTFLRSYYSNGLKIDTLTVVANSQELTEGVATAVINVLEARHHNRGKDLYHAENTMSILDQINNVLGIFTAFIGAVAAISLVVGGIGVMNIMLVSVTERTREIGIRKAIGATTRSILVQFLIEAMLISLIGGIIGMLLGILGADFIGELAGISPVISPWAVIGAIGFSSLVGIFFGIYPARKAAALDPIEALRYE